MTRRALSALTVILLFLTLSGCSHSVLITTDPTGANVTVNGQMIGQSPVTFVEKSGFNRNYSVSINKDGYRPIDTVLSQTLNPTYAVVAGLVFMFTLCPLGVLWMFTLEDNYHFTLGETGPSAEPY